MHFTTKRHWASLFISAVMIMGLTAGAMAEENSFSFDGTTFLMSVPQAGAALKGEVLREFQGSQSYYLVFKSLLGGQPVVVGCQFWENELIAYNFNVLIDTDIRSDVAKFNAVVAAFEGLYGPNQADKSDYTDEQMIAAGFGFKSASWDMGDWAIIGYWMYVPEDGKVSAQVNFEVVHVRNREKPKVEDAVHLQSEPEYIALMDEIKRDREPVFSCMDTSFLMSEADAESLIGKAVLGKFSDDLQHHLIFRTTIAGQDVLVGASFWNDKLIAYNLNVKIDGDMAADVKKFNAMVAGFEEYCGPNQASKDEFTDQEMIAAGMGFKTANWDLGEWAILGYWMHVVKDGNTSAQINFEVIHKLNRQKPKVEGSKHLQDMPEYKAILADLGW